jgi:integrase/recombinase XerD
LTYLHSVGVETFDPRLVSLGQVVRSSPDTISPAEVTRLLDAPDTSSLEGMRDRAILHLLCSTGVRVAELTNLDLKDIDMSQEECVVCSKHHEEKIVPLSDTTIDAIAMYVDNRSDHHDALFVRHGRKRNDGGDLRLAPRAVQRLVRHYAIVVGITTRVTPLTLRHSFAARLMSSGTDVRVIQSRLRHSSTAVTRGYISQQKTRREEDEVCE